LNKTIDKFGHQDYDIIHQELLYQGIFRLLRYSIRQRLFQGGYSPEYSRELLQRLPAAAVLPYDPKKDRVILIEQFRIGGIEDPQSPWLLEIPAGVITKNDTPETIAYHECEEEAGCRIEKLHRICEYFVSPGGSNEYLTLYCGKTDSTNVQGIHGLENEFENIRVLNLSFAEAMEKLLAGEIKTSPAIISLQWLALHKEQLKKDWT